MPMPRSITTQPDVVHLRRWDMGHAWCGILEQWLDGYTATVNMVSLVENVNCPVCFALWEAERNMGIIMKM